MINKDISNCGFITVHSVIIQLKLSKCMIILTLVGQTLLELRHSKLIRVFVVIGSVARVSTNNRLYENIINIKFIKYIN